MNAPPSNPAALRAPAKATISFTRACNLNCRFCYADCNAAPGPDELDLHAWKRVLDELIELGAICFLFEGGEPLARADFIDLVSHVSDRALCRVRTHGALIDPAMAQRLQAANTGTVLIDLFAADPAVHDFLTGTPGSFQRTIAGVRALQDVGLPVEFLAILNRHNIDGMQRYLDFAHGLGIDTVGILRPYPIGRARRRWQEMCPSLDAMTAMLDALVIPDGLKLNQSWHPNNANCCWQMAAVDPDGRSIGCAYLREYVDYGSVVEDGFMATWNDPLYRKLRAGQVEKSCTTCEAREMSRGGCRSSAFALTGRWDAPDPFDITLNGGIDVRSLP